MNVLSRSKNKGEPCATITQLSELWRLATATTAEYPVSTSAAPSTAATGLPTTIRAMATTANDATSTAASETAKEKA